LYEIRSRGPLKPLIEVRISAFQQRMNSQEHIVIFSHGFGVKKDDRGLLSGPEGIAEALQREGIETILFDYNELNEADNTMVTTPLSAQAKILENVITETREKNLEAVIDIVAHSQGCIAPAILLPKNIRKIVFIAPSFDAEMERMIDYFKKYPETEINLDGVTKLGRSDGSITYVPSLCWIDRGNTEPIPLYNQLSKITNLKIIRAGQDHILGAIEMNGLNEKIESFLLDGNHSFENEAREPLISKIRELLLS